MVTMTAATWRQALEGDRLLVSGFGRWGGGLYDLTTGRPDAIDDLPTSGIALGDGCLWRVLRAPGEQTGACELLSYDQRGVHSYQRLDAVRDPHDLCWHNGALHVTSSWDDTVWRVAGGEVEPVWRAGSVADAWHVNSLIVVDGALHLCAFGRFDRHKAWKTASRKDTGFVLDLRSGRDVLAGLTHPHAPRRRHDRWYVCESTAGWLTELDGEGNVLRRAAVQRFTRGLALVGGWALVGGNARRGHDTDRAELVVVDLDAFEVVERIPLPCLEVYDILPTPAALVRGAAIGFGTNASRAVEQHRSVGRPAAHRSTPADVAVRLVRPSTAERLAGMGRPVRPSAARRYEVLGTMPAELAAATAAGVTVEVANGTGRPLGSVLPRPIKVGARWFRIVEGRRQAPVANPLAPLPTVVPAGCTAPVDVLLEVPDEPGLYEVWVALHQPRSGWFGGRLQAEVTVVPGGAVPASGLLGPERGEEDDVADRRRVGQQHDQAVHADAQAAGGR